MSKVIYFNITYSCNNKCTFCFSNSTGKQNISIPLEEIKARLHPVDIQGNDSIIINGGEPTIHPQFYNIVSFLCETYDAKITVYSNGRNIETEQINYNDKLKFIIPIHGIETTHDAITRVPNSFKETINTLFAFEKVKQKYAIKFIFNEEMIRTNFNIYGFLNENMFNPEEIIFARLNFTDKGQKNNVVIPKSEALREYVEKQFKVLSSFFKIKFIDIPFCYIKNSKVDVAEEKKPSFFFNDSNKIMLETNYYKDMLINSSCVKCEWYKLCKIMSSSYLTLTYNDDIWQIEKE